MTAFMKQKQDVIKKGILGTLTLRNERYDDGRKKNAMYRLEDKVEDLSQKKKDKRSTTRKKQEKGN